MNTFGAFGEPLRIIETTRWEIHLQISLEIALAHAKERGPVEFWLFESADTSRFEALSELYRHLEKFSFVRKMPKYSAQHSLFRRFERHIQKESLPIDCRFVPRVEWDSMEIDFSDFRSVTFSELALDGLPAGSYINSTMCWFERTSSPNLQSWLVGVLARKFYNLSRFQRTFLTSNEQTPVVIFNGRFVENGPTVGICRELGIPLRFHERNSYYAERYFYESYRPHDIRAQATEASNLWLDLGQEDRELATQRAIKFLEAPSSSKGLSPGLVPSKKIHTVPEKTSKPRVVFFSSTETEFVLDEISPQSAFETQFEAIEALYESCTTLGWELIVRVHPNQSELNRKDRLRWNKSLQDSLPNATVFGSDSGVNSDELLQTSDLVAVWKSSMAVKAIYSGKPTLAFCETVYEHSGADLHRLSSPSDLSGTMISMIGSTPDSLSVVPYVHHLISSGKRMTYLDTGAFRQRGISLVFRNNSIRRLLQIFRP